MSVYRIQPGKESILGEGAYGKVYLAEDPNGKMIAAKRCDIDKEGISNIMELNIMSSFNHPHISRSEKIFRTDKGVYILQDLALCDIIKYIKDMKDSREKINKNTYKKWFFQLAMALCCLHEQNIVHGDIKGKNILYYKNGDIKLTDFTLSRYVNKKSKYSGELCTSTHRPPECFVDSGWDLSLDIWALGCTFYEIYYERLPLDIKINKGKKRESKEEINDRMYRSIKYWCGDKNVDTNGIIYGTIPENYAKNCNSKINDLIKSMLKFNQNDRITIQDVLRHPYFDIPIESQSITYEIIHNKTMENDNIDQEILDSIIENDKIKIFITELYPRIYPRENLKIEDLIHGCVRIYEKIIYGKIKASILKNNYIDIENRILELLDYKIHIPGFNLC